jgi:hypothetical protein
VENGMSCGLCEVKERDELTVDVGLWTNLGKAGEKSVGVGVDGLGV